MTDDAMTAGELRAALDGVRDEARLIGEVSAGFLFGERFDVERVMPIGGSTDDPGVVFKLVPIVRGQHGREGQVD